MQLIKLYDKYDRELFLDMQHTVVVKQNTLMRRIILWLQRLMCKMLSCSAVPLYTQQHPALEKSSGKVSR